MFFSVVIPTHKRKTLLQNLLRSLEAQSIEKGEFEVIVVATESDEAFDLSRDNFNLDMQLTFIPNDPYLGRSASAKRNYGASLAKAPWIAFVDDDCITDTHWLNAAKQALSNNKYQFAEGHVNIPVPERKTFTYKGIQRLSKPGGFQTCNMFYRKDIFNDIGGFDLNFPYYLEDTDLAWSFLDNKHHATYINDATVSHPVPPGAPHKMLESAYRSQKIPYLYKKHPKRFKQSKMRAYPRSFLILLILDLSFLLALFTCPQISLLALGLRLTLTGVLLFRMLKGCQTDLPEVTKMYYYLLICPPVSFLSLMKGNLKQGVFVFIK